MPLSEHCIHDECTRGASLITYNDGKRSNLALGGGGGGELGLYLDLLLDSV